MRMHHIGTFRNDCGKTDFFHMYLNLLLVSANSFSFTAESFIVKYSVKLQQNCLDFNYTYGCSCNSSSYVNLI